MGSVTDDTEVENTGVPAARTVTIREARPDELAAVGEIRVLAYVAGGFLSPDSGYAPRLRTLGADREGTVLVAVTDASAGAGNRGGAAAAGQPSVSAGQIVGTVMLVMHPQTSEIAAPDEAEIRALAVAPGTQGMGVGRTLLRAVLDRAARHGARGMVLSTQQEMHAAHRLYEQAGFARLPDRDWSPEPGLTLLAYGLPLPPAAPG
jgi:ribosomal protein S18 acetylase RimI-like enzyme